MVSELPEIIRSTERLASTLLISAVLISLGILYASALLIAGIFTVLLTLSLFGYARTSASLVANSRLRVETSGVSELDEVEISCTICNEKPLPVAFLELSIRVPEHLRISRGTAGSISILPPRGCVTHRLWIYGRPGRHSIGPFTAVVRDPLGLFRSSEIVLRRSLELRIVPQTLYLQLARVMRAHGAAGLARSGSSGPGIEFYSVREYRYGDEPKRIIWRQTARWGRLMVKETERELSLSVVYAIHMSPEMFRGPYRGTPFELSLRTTATLARYSSTRGDLMSLAISAPRWTIIAGPARGRAGYIKILSALASLEFAAKATPQPQDLFSGTRISGALSEGSVLIVFTSPGSLWRSYVDALRSLDLVARSRRSACYIAVINPETRPDMPNSPEELAKVPEVIRSNKRLASELRRSGAKVLILRGGTAIPHIVRLLELARG